MRTFQYGADSAALAKPVALSIDPASAASRPGQVAFLALVEMLFRIHRNVRLDVPQVVLSTGETLRDASLRTAAAIDPFQDPVHEPADDEHTVIVSSHPVTASPSPDVTATWSGGRGEVSIRGARADKLHASQPDRNTADASQERDVLGAATSACLAAAALFTLVHDGWPTPAAINLLTLSADANTDTAVGPIDVGNILVVGGGAVGHALTYWANIFGIRGGWAVIDGDTCELHNTNRCMGMTVADAGWPEGAPTGRARPKAESAAENCSARSIPLWYRDAMRHEARPDLILVLANEQGVRESIASQGEPLLLHATTSSQWTAELHRHIPDRDDCPACRIPSHSRASFACAEGPARPADPASSDAALPFLSAGAGLMLCVALLDLDKDARILRGRTNHWRLHLELPAGSPIQEAIHRGTSCPHHLKPSVRRSLYVANPRRWDDLPNERRHTHPMLPAAFAAKPNWLHPG